MPRRYKIQLLDPETETKLTAFADAADRQMLTYDLFEGDNAVTGWVVTGIQDRRRDLVLDLPVSEHTQRQVLRGVRGANETMRATLAGYYQRNTHRAVTEGFRTIYG